MHFDVVYCIMFVAPHCSLKASWQLRVQVPGRVCLKDQNTTYEQRYIL